eukprot:1466815-Rhodomonas_salina.1
MDTSVMMCAGCGHKCCECPQQHPLVSCCAEGGAGKTLTRCHGVGRRQTRVLGVSCLEKSGSAMHKTLCRKLLRDQKDKELEKTPSNSTSANPEAPEVVGKRMRVAPEKFGRGKKFSESTRDAHQDEVADGSMGKTPVVKEVIRPGFIECAKCLRVHHWRTKCAGEVLSHSVVCRLAQYAMSGADLADGPGGRRSSQGNSKGGRGEACAQKRSQARTRKRDRTRSKQDGRGEESVQRASHKALRPQKTSRSPRHPCSRWKGTPSSSSSSSFSASPPQMLSAVPETESMQRRGGGDEGEEERGASEQHEVRLLHAPTHSSILMHGLMSS